MGKVISYVAPLALTCGMLFLVRNESGGAVLGSMFLVMPGIVSHIWLDKGFSGDGWKLLV